MLACGLGFDVVWYTFLGFVVSFCLFVLICFRLDGCIVNLGCLRFACSALRLVWFGIAFGGVVMMIVWLL